MMRRVTSAPAAAASFLCVFRMDPERLHLRPNPGAGGRGRRGQAMIESCLVVAIVALCLFGLLQLSKLFTAREVLDYAASCGARARAVGFNDFMVYKVVRVASIPNAGRMTSPGYDRGAGLAGAVAGLTPGELWDLALGSTPVSPQLEVERSRVPLYLAADRYGELAPILDYEDWDTLNPGVSELSPTLVRQTLRQDVPMRLPFHRAFYAADSLREEGEADMDSHAGLYLE